jgi:hypothetical protein
VTRQSRCRRAAGRPRVPARSAPWLCRPSPITGARTATPRARTTSGPSPSSTPSVIRRRGAPGGP